MTDNTTDKFVTHLESVCKSIRFWPSWKQEILGFCPIQTIERKIRMTTEYPLTLAEARAALVNELPRTEIESSDKYRWRREDKYWYTQIKTPSSRFWRSSCLGPDPTLVNETYRIIPIGHPDHSEYVAPKGQHSVRTPYKPLTAEEALALERVWVVYPYCAGEHTELAKGFNWSWDQLVFLDLAERKSWPIVATREEAEAVLKERG